MLHLTDQSRRTDTATFDDEEPAEIAQDVVTILAKVAFGLDHKDTIITRQIQTVAAAVTIVMDAGTVIAVFTMEGAIRIVETELMYCLLCFWSSQ